MIEAAARVEVHRALPPEEQARADFYALLARLFHGAPDGALLASLAGAQAIPPDGEAQLALAWSKVIAASSVMDAQAADYEYQQLFQGVGSAEVSIYSAFYTGAPAIDHPRVRLKADLRLLGLGKPESVTEPDDHFAALFDAMRVLAGGGAGRAAGSIAEQKQFFESHVAAGVEKFFRAVETAPSANYYRTVAALGRAFLALESESFRLG